VNQFHSVAERAAGVHQQRGEGHQGEARTDTVVRGGDSQVCQNVIVLANNKCIYFSQLGDPDLNKCTFNSKTYFLFYEPFSACFGLKLERLRSHNMQKKYSDFKTVEEIAKE
jgi:hypothetical protein